MTAAFTLVEVLVALVLVAVVLGAAHSLWAATARQNEMTWHVQQQRAAAGTVAEVLERDLAGFYPRWSEQPPLELARSGMAAARRLELTLTTAADQFSPAGGQRPLVRRVTYRIEPSPQRTGAYRMRRSEAAYPADGRARGELLLMDGITSFEVEAYDGTDWVDEWPVGDSVREPVALRVRVGFAGSNAPGLEIVKAFDVDRAARVRIMPRRERQEETE